MADYDLKSISADTDGPSADTELLFGSPDQSSSTPKPYSFAGIKIWIKAFITAWKVYSHASAAPGVGNDNTQGYGVGSVGIITGTGDVFLLRDTSTGAAKWVRYSPADFFGYKANNWYWPDRSYIPAAGNALTASVIRLHPVIIKQRCTIGSLGVWVQTGIASGNVQLALYASDPTTLMPTGNALGSTASISVASSTVNVSAALGAAAQVEPGLYWLASNVDATAGGTLVCSGISGAGSLMSSVIGSATEANINGAANNNRLFLTVSQTFGTWPDLTSASFTESTAATNALVHFKVTAVP